MLRKFRKLVLYTRQNGCFALIKFIVARLRNTKNPFSKIDVISHYDDLVGEPFGIAIEADSVSKKSITWFIPPVGKGSGGHLNIFRFVKFLEDKGFDNRIVIVGDPQPASRELAKREITEWFNELDAPVFLGVGKDIPHSYFSFATSWPTAYYVKRFRSCIKKCYFVQDFEPWFYPSGSDSMLAEHTYDFDFHGVTAGGWLAEKLKTDYGMETFPLGFSFDKKLYKPSIKEDNRVNRRVFFYARPPTARRAFELGLLVLRNVCKILSDVEVVLAGWDLKGYEIPFPCQHAGLVELDQLAELYSGCDVALILSCSNLSLLPLEVMACGVPVVSNRAPFTQWLLNDENSKLAEANIEDLSSAVVEVLENKELAASLVKDGLAFAQSTSWQDEADKFAEHLHLLSEKKAQIE